MLSDFKRIVVAIAIAIALVFFAGRANSAEEISENLFGGEPDLFVAYIVNMDDGTYFLRYRGGIGPHTMQVMRNVQYFRPEVTHIEISSGGGDFFMGLVLGSTIKKMKLPILIPEGEVCLSSCAFAAMASPDLTVDGWIGFHAPYLPDGFNGEVADILKIGTLIGGAGASYFHDMKWKAAFWKEILLHTSEDTYMMYDNVDVLMPMQFTEDEIFTGAYLRPEYNFMSIEQVRALVKTASGVE